jgi:hypothetical protein
LILLIHLFKLFVKHYFKEISIDKKNELVYKGGMDRKKITSLGINGPVDLRSLLGCSMSLAYKIWYGKAKLSVKQARVLKEKKGASLDYLLS